MIKADGFALIKHYRKGTLLSASRRNNAVTVEGRAAMLRSLFMGEANNNHWYVGLSDRVNYYERDPGDPDAANAYGLLYESRAYGTTRPEIDVGNLGSYQIFEFRQPTEIVGFFIINEEATGKMGTVTWSSTIFPPDRGTYFVVPGDQFLIAYSTTLTGSTNDGSFTT